MKSLYSFLLILYLGAQLNAQLEFGVNGGVSFSTISSIGAEKLYNSERTREYHLSYEHTAPNLLLGLNLSFRAKYIVLGMALNFRNNINFYRLKEIGLFSVKDIMLENQYFYLYLPIEGGFQFGELRFSAGPCIRFIFNSDATQLEEGLVIKQSDITLGYNYFLSYEILDQVLVRLIREIHFSGIAKRFWINQTEGQFCTLQKMITVSVQMNF